MSETQMEGKGVQAQYGAQVAADIQGNASALNWPLSKTVCAPCARIILQVQRALGTAGSTAGAPEEAAEPEVEEAGEVPKPRRTSAGEDAAPQNTSPAGKPEEGGHEGGKPSSVGVKAAKPTLVILVRDQFTQQAEPRSAAEITAALVRADPDRCASDLSGGPGFRTGWFGQESARVLRVYDPVRYLRQAEAGFL
ncbi:hypothetical protein AB0M29_40735 [Streptomyces sp. NPDC051976]|uniref:hypothetical protein n=1 Tax=Streptomyces sp. NPDC051976 TaxID=3154947 RepID=UPI0034383ECA